MGKREGRSGKEEGGEEDREERSGMKKRMVGKGRSLRDRMFRWGRKECGIEGE